MSEELLSITDADGDKLVVQASDRPDAVAYLECRQSGGDGVTEQAAVVLDAQQVDEVVGALLATTNRKAVSAESLVQASEVSFNEAMLRLASIHKRPVRFRYAKGDGEFIESRVLNPEALVGTGDDLAVIGHDPDDRAGNTRSFWLDRIKGEVVFA
jgi:hypothetical protein